MRGLTLAALLVFPAVANSEEYKMVVASPGDTISLPISASMYDQDEGTGTVHPKLSVLSPEFIELKASSSALESITIPAGGSQGTSLDVGIPFHVSTSAPTGCTAVVYGIRFPIRELVIRYYPIHFRRLFITPRSTTAAASKDIKRQMAACSTGKPRVDWNWRWRYRRPDSLPEEYMPTRNIPLVPDAYSGESLPRGEYGFHLGASLAEVDANAEKRGLEDEPDSNDSVRPDQWRFFHARRDPQIYSISMFLMKGPVDEISISFWPRDKPPKFEVMRDRLRKKLGMEKDSTDQIIDVPAHFPSMAQHHHYQNAYWADCRTLIKLSGDTNSLGLSYYDLSHGTTIRFHIIGRGGRVPSFSGCENE